MKTKTRYLLLCIGFILTIIVGLILLPTRWSYIFYGVLAFVVGSVALTEEWKARKRVRSVVFIIAIAVGGLLTTKGWNELECYYQKKALIVGLAREWLLNELYYTSIFGPTSLDTNDPNFGKVHFMYRQFRTSAQDRILTSSLFDLINLKDKDLLNAVISYEDSIKNFNALLDQMNEACLKFPEDVKQQKRKEVYLRIRDKAPLHIHFKRFHKELLELLKKEYGWALIEARPTIANIHHVQEQQNNE